MRVCKCAFTTVELLAVAAIFGLLMALALSALAKARAKSQRIHCVENLKHIGLGSRLFGTDSGDPFTWQTSDYHAKGKVAPSETLLRYFRNMSKGLATPSLLTCPADTRRSAENWAVLSPTNISYFLGLDSAELYPQSILAGDRNITTNGVRVGPGLVRISTNAVMGWDKTMHVRQGSLIMGDGSVHQMSGPRFREAVFDSGVDYSGVSFVVP